MRGWGGCPGDKARTPRTPEKNTIAPTCRAPERGHAAPDQLITKIRKVPRILVAAFRRPNDASTCGIVRENENKQTALNAAAHCNWTRHDTREHTVI